MSDNTPNPPGVPGHVVIGATTATQPVPLPAPQPASASASPVLTAPGLSPSRLNPAQRATLGNQVSAIAFWVLLSLAVLVFAGFERFTSLPFRNNLSNIPNVLGALLIVSLFVERVIEVFVSIWQDPECDLLEQQLDNWQRLQVRRSKEITELATEASDPKTSEPRRTDIAILLVRKRQDKEEAEKNEELVERQLVPFEARIRRVTTWVGLAIGILASAVGFRFFDQIVDTSSLPNSKVQSEWFIVVDVLLTGAILAAGSKAIHSIFSVYDSFMESTRKRADQSGNK